MSSELSEVWTAMQPEFRIKLKNKPSSDIDLLYVYDHDCTHSTRDSSVTTSPLYNCSSLLLRSRNHQQIAYLAQGRSHLWNGSQSLAHVMHCVCAIQWCLRWRSRMHADASTFFYQHPLSSDLVHPAVFDMKNRIYIIPPFAGIKWLMTREELHVKGQRSTQRCQGSEVNADARSGTLLPAISVSAKAAAAATFEAINGWMATEIYVVRDYLLPSYNYIPTSISLNKW